VSFEPTDYYDQAVNLVNQGRYDLAERQLRRSLEENPDHAASYALLGICLARLRRPQEALAAADQGVRLGPDSAFVHYAKACVRVHARQSKCAIKDVEEAIRIDPTRPNQFFLLAAIYSDLRYPRRSLAQAERGLELDPDHTGCASLRALALQRLGRKREADAAISLALTLDPASDFTHTAQGWRLLQKHQRKAASEHFLEALRINPANRWAQNGLSSVNWAIRAERSLILLMMIPVMFALAALLTSKAQPAIRIVSLALLIPFAGAGLFALGAELLRLRDWLRDRRGPREAH
jgi:tetratricopeptide (TPR) repeat protein